MRSRRTPRLKPARHTRPRWLRSDSAISKMRQRELSSAKLDVKKSKLNAEKDVLDEVRADLLKRLTDMPKEKKVDIIQKLINMSRKDIATGKIFTNAADADLVKNSGYEYGGNIKCIGGIMVTSVDGSINLDYTFDSIHGGCLDLVDETRIGYPVRVKVRKCLR